VNIAIFLSIKNIKKQPKIQEKKLISFFLTFYLGKLKKMNKPYSPIIDAGIKFIFDLISGKNFGCYPSFGPIIGIVRNFFRVFTVYSYTLNKGFENNGL